MNKNKVDVKVKMDTDDIMLFQKYITRNKSYFKFMVLLMPFTLICVALVNRNNALFATIFCMAAIFLLLDYFRKGGKVPLAEQKEMKKEAVYSFTPDGFGVETTTRESFGKWDSLQAYQETDDAFYIYVTDYKIFAVPKHFFADEGEIDLARSYISVVPAVEQSNDRLFSKLNITFFSYAVMFVFALAVLIAGFFI